MGPAPRRGASSPWPTYRGRNSRDDAIRAGVLREGNLPPSTHEVLGCDHSSRIETLVVDAVRTSAAEDDIRLSPRVWDAMAELREFLFDNVYTSRCHAWREVAKAMRPSMCSSYYIENPGEIPVEYRAISEGDDVRAATDYIAGMTDRYAKSREPSLNPIIFMRKRAMTNLKTDLQASFTAALPIVLGYVAIGVPCGILCDSIGLNALQVFAMSVLFYSGAGQFMIPNMWLAGAPIASIIASVSFVNTRQMLYWPRSPSARRKRLAFLFAATADRRELRREHPSLRRRGGGAPGPVREPVLVHLLDALCTVGVLVGNAIGISASGDRLLRYDLDLHLPSVHAESECGKRGCRCGRDARRLRVQAGGAHRPLHPSARSRRGRRPCVLR